jgi:hypothetical protein
MTAHERTGWRDQEISNRHRQWGFNCPGADLDFVMVEYNFGAPVAVVEYKHHKSNLIPNPSNPTIRAIGSLYSADGQQLPLFIAKYWPESWAFRVCPYNEMARLMLMTDEWMDYTEREWVSLLYALRSQHLTNNVLSQLNDYKPPSAPRLTTV